MGKCGSTFSKNNQILLAGIETCGKTYFLFQHLKHEDLKNQTSPTHSFNYEKIENDPYEAFIWDLPGKENLRIFWPNFYRNIIFHGVIYMINYDNKDKLDESVQVMHDLLNEDELKNVVVLIILNYKNRDYNELIENKNEDLSIEEVNKNKINMNNSYVVNQMKKDILFDLLPQKEKDLYYLDLFDNQKENGIKNRMKEFLAKLT